ncbi:MAG TPA: response regulator transcription factor, partial [Candidatus Baltobacteraceae bacterium]
CDDQAAFRKGLRDLLARTPDIEIAGEATNGKEAIEAALRLRPDITLMDIRMPVLDGVAATAAIREKWPDACVIVLTTFDEDHLIRSSMRAGASGYLLKGTPLEDMRAIFALVMRGYTALGKGVRPARDGGDQRLERLTQREREILALVGEGMTNRDIAETLFLTEGTVKNYISQVLETLGVRSRTEAALLWRNAAS